MKLDISGEEIFEVSIETLWSALNDPAVLKKCIPGCKEMIPDGGERREGAAGGTHQCG